MNMDIIYNIIDKHDNITPDDIKLFNDYLEINEVSFKIEDRDELLENKKNHEIENYELLLVPDLKKICKYYDILNRKKQKKNFLIKQIIDFENNKINKEIVNKRKLLWMFYNELKQDKFFKHHLNII